MIAALTILLGCQLVGEILARALSVPVPGPVIGLALLAAGLWWNAHRTNAPPAAIEQTQLGKVSLALLANLGLMFVPAGVGVVEQLPVLGGNAVAISIALVASTVLTLVITVARLCPRQTADPVVGAAITKLVTASGMTGTPPDRACLSLGLSRGLAAPVAHDHAGRVAPRERGRANGSGIRSPTLS